MKPKMIWSVAAVFAGAGFATAQDAASTMQSAAAAKPTAITPVNFNTGCNTGCDTGCAPAVNWNGGNSFRPSFYGSAELLIWRMGSRLSGSGQDTLPAVRADMPFGILTRSVNNFQNGTVTTRDVINNFGIVRLDPVLFAGSSLDESDRNGARLRLGYQFNSLWAVEASFFQLEQKNSNYQLTANGIFRNFTNGLEDYNEGIVGGLGDFTPTTFDVVANANISGTSKSRVFGLELNARHQSFIIGNVSLSEIYGLRFIEHSESQDLLQVLSMNNPIHIGSDDGVGNFVTTGTNFTSLVANLSSRNQFFGFQVGFAADVDFGRLLWKNEAKLAIGAVRQQYQATEFVVTSDTTALVDGTPANSVPIDVYPNPTAFRENRTRLSFLPELSTSLQYNLFGGVSVSAGYNFMYIYRVERPSGVGLPRSGTGSITQAGDSTAARGPSLTNFTEGRLFLHGLTAGLSIQF